MKDKLDSGCVEVVTVGYDLFTRHKDTIAQHDWLVVVFDEMHMLKNPKSKRYRKKKKITTPTHARYTSCILANPHRFVCLVRREARHVAAEEKHQVDGNIIPLPRFFL